MDSDFEVIAQQLSIYQISLHDIQHKETLTQQGTLQGFSSLSLKINTFSNQKTIEHVCQKNVLLISRVVLDKWHANQIGYAFCGRKNGPLSTATQNRTGVSKAMHAINFLDTKRNHVNFMLLIYRSHLEFKALVWHFVSVVVRNVRLMLNFETIWRRGL